MDAKNIESGDEAGCRGGGEGRHLRELQLQSRSKVLTKAEEAYGKISWRVLVRVEAVRDGDAGRSRFCVLLQISAADEVMDGWGALAKLT